VKVARGGRMTCSMPCPASSPDESYSSMRLATIARRLGDFHSPRNRINASPNLIHRGRRLAEKLEARPHRYQHAIQKIAVRRAATTSRRFKTLVKSLN